MNRWLALLSLPLLVLGALSAHAAEDHALASRRLKDCMTNGQFRCLVSPVPSAKVTDAYGHREPVRLKDGRYTSDEHGGTDFRAPYGTEVFAVFPGVVTRVVRDEPTCGNFIDLSFGGNGDLVRYCHLSRIDVSQGDQVGLEYPIGRSGESGAANAPHLHIQYRHRGEWVDPLPFMFPREDLPSELLR